MLCGTSPPQLLIPDEPTNHLDLDSVQAEEQALGGFDGAWMGASQDVDVLAALGLTRRIALPMGSPGDVPGRPGRAPYQLPSFLSVGVFLYWWPPMRARSAISSGIARIR